MSATHATAPTDPSAAGWCEGCGLRPATHNLDEHGRGDCAECAERYAADYARIAGIVEQLREVLDRGREAGIDDDWLEIACQDALSERVLEQGDDVACERPGAS